MCDSSGLQCCGRTLLVFKNNTNARYVRHLSVRKFSLFDGTQEEKKTYYTLMTRVRREALFPISLSSEGGCNEILTLISWSDFNNEHKFVWKTGLISFRSCTFLNT